MKRLLLVAAVGALLGISGVGFAIDAGGGCGGNGGCNSQPSIEWVAPSATAPSGAGLHCSLTTSPTQLTGNAVGFSPGSFCWLNGTLLNNGNTPVTLVPHISADLPAGCLLYTYTDNLLTASPQVELKAGQSFPYHAKYGLESSAGDRCELTVVQFVVTITASGQPSCQGFGSGDSTPSQGECCG